MSYHRKTTSTASSAGPSEVSESRKRQSKRDDAIRRKIEHDLSKKKRGSTRLNRSRKAAPGTVLSLNPLDPVVCKPSITVYEAAQLMTAKRENCILVINESGQLQGIFTAKDLAFRIVGLGLNASTVTIDQIMTPNPTCANANSPASDALSLMVSRGFRHLPVLDDNNQIVGVLDITKSYAQQMEKLERMHASSKKLYEALDSVQLEIGISQHPHQVFQYFENLKTKMNTPTLTTVLDHTTVPVYTTVKTSVYDATVLMKENKTTAVLVRDTNDEVTGIFTSKDVVLRVIAAGLDPKKCSIVRVMTPQPDVASHDSSIQLALRQMFNGHYLNLPVVDEQKDIIGIVDVLKLTYATLHQIKQIEDEEASQKDEEGPAWNKFWTFVDDDAHSAHSDSLAESAPGVSASDINSFTIETPIKPSDLVLAVEDRPEQPFTFKFTSPAGDGRVHRISLRPSEGLERFRHLVDSKLQNKDFDALRVARDGDEHYAISYFDDEGDVVSITTDTDLVDCVRINRALNNDKADVYLHNANDPAHNIKQFRRNDLVPGISNEVLILGVVAVLASSIVLGFTLSRK